VGDSDVVSTNYIRMNQRTPTAAATYGGLEFFYDNTAGITGVNAAIRYASGAARNDGELTFYTGSSGSTSEAMRIDSSGNVGIGTDNPTVALEIHDDSAKIHLRDTSTAATGVGGVMRFQGNTSGTGAPNNFAEIKGVKANGTTGGEFVVRTSDTAGSLQERMRIDSSGAVMVGKTSSGLGGDGVVIKPEGKLAVTRDAGAAGQFNRESNDGALLVFYRAQATAGSIAVSGTTTTYNTSSDVRLKRNIVDAPSGNIDDIKIRSFEWKINDSHQKYGVIAQELFEVAPEAVSQGETEEDAWGVDYSKLVPMMIKEIQDLKAEVAALKGA
jgi:hypothetical protein